MRAADFDGWEPRAGEREDLLKKNGRQLSQIKDQFKDITHHFSKEEWAELSEWEKVRYKNVKRNYEAMLAIEYAVFASPPDAIMCLLSMYELGAEPSVEELSKAIDSLASEVRTFKPPFKNDGTKKTKKDNSKKNEKRQLANASHLQEDKDAGLRSFNEGTPSVLEETVSVKKRNRETNTAMSEFEAQNESIKVVCAGKTLESSSEETHNEKEERRYSLRNKERKIYTEERELCDEDFLFCEDCKRFFVEECPVHGPPVFIKDMAVEFNQPDRARLTLPEGLSIAISKIRKAGLGVWNEGKAIPKGVHFGPYEGVTSNEESAAVSGYSWVISKGKQDFEYIDAKDESKSNWMRFVNCARKEEEQNLVAFQHHGKIYYRTCKRVPPRCELLVWYGDEYAKELGINWTAMWMMKQNPKEHRE
ncbi:histone-lysine N-methyltransferase PRDM9 [Chiloscyllium plagiosum]|uniref:histone-lysine N-methyltransferase PRDM9 n=1 Tax=Chiloscyllium plagiosum TaxID=36176 RepID=UPI001CB8223E|nr:histone-lysine N-methyltransferase PRDM9 [Chiloscyllium plagiosum]